MISCLARSIGLLPALVGLLLTTRFAASTADARPVPDASRCLTRLADGRSQQGGALAAVPAARQAMLARGVNITDLFGTKQDPDLGAMFRRLRAAGLRHVRIPISPAAFSPDPPSWQGAALMRLDQAVCAALGQGLGVVIDLHPVKALGPANEPVDATAARLSEIWHRLAGRYQAAPSDRVFFEILNEPKLSVEDWGRVQPRLLQAIRSVAPRNTVIATASPWSTAAALAGLTPLQDPNVVYSFHFYTPMIFTHQGAGWSLPPYDSIRGLDFPAHPDNVAAVAVRAGAGREAELSSYGRTFRTTEPIEHEIDSAAEWARRWKTMLVVTEFGVYAEAAPRDARATWLATVRHTLEAHHIGWTVWEYQGGFGIAGDLNHGCMAPGSPAAALGLCRP
jgi:endoglucanase